MLKYDEQYSIEGMYPLETNRDVRTLKCQCKVRNMPRKRLPARADRAVSEEVTKG